MLPRFSWAGQCSVSIPRWAQRWIFLLAPAWWTWAALLLLQCFPWSARVRTAWRTGFQLWLCLRQVFAAKGAFEEETISRFLQHDSCHYKHIQAFIMFHKIRIRSSTFFFKKELWYRRGGGHWSVYFLATGVCHEVICQTLVMQYWWLAKHNKLEVQLSWRQPGSKQCRPALSASRALC